MSESYGRIIESLAIERDTETFGLRIKLSLIESAEPLWLTDNETIVNIAAVTEFDGVHKHRISLHTAWDANKQQYIGSITRTYREHSERFSFACSVPFRNELESIKEIRHADDLHTRLFSTHRSEADQPEEIPAAEGDLKTNRFARKRRHLPLKLVSAIIMSLIFVVLLSSFNYSYPGDIKPYPAVTATAEAETVIQLLAENRSAMIAKPVATSKEEAAESRPKESKPKDNKPSASIPQLELEEFISFSLPKGYVALTFDDGPSKHSIDIMNVLKTRGWRNVLLCWHQCKNIPTMSGPSMRTDTLSATIP